MPHTVRPLRRPRPFSGSYLETACFLDAACPGFLNRLLHASDLRRSAIFAALAEVKLVGTDEVASRLCGVAPAVCHLDLDAEAQIARALVILRAREIVLAIFGSVPDGFLGLLARLGGDPLPNPADYRLAFCLFGDAAHKARAKLLRQIPGRVSPMKIQAAARLDPILLHAAVLNRVSDREHVDALNAAVGIIRTLVPEASDDALRQSLDGLSPTDRGMSRWVSGWLRRMTRLPVTLPIPANDPDLRVLDGPGMVELARRFRNCAADRVGYVAANSRAYLQWVGPGSPAAVELRCLSGGHFVIEDIKGVGNSEPEAGVADAIRTKLKGLGVFTYSGTGRRTAGEALMHLLGTWESEFVEPERFLAELLAEAA